MKIEVKAEPACYSCFHYSGQFSDFPSHIRSGVCEFDPIAKGFVEADHYCKRFTLVNSEMPTTLSEVIAALADEFDNKLDDDCDIAKTVAEWIAEEWETPEQAIRTFFDNNPVLDWTVSVSVEWSCQKGAGWGSYYGPTPDEYSGRAAVNVSNSKGKTLYDDERCVEDVSGSDITEFIVGQLTTA